jgi:predicted amidohydrolase
MKIGFIQTLPFRMDVAGNLDALEFALDSGGLHADLWVLPELFTTGYLFCDRAELLSVAQAADGRTADRLHKVAVRHSSSFVAGFAESAGGHVFNSAMAVDGDGLKAVYRKTHLFDNEKKWFEPGDSGFVVTRLAGVQVGIMICYDWRFPESARTLALAGAQIIAHPSNLVLKTCQDAMVTRALENGVFTVTANRVGMESVGGVSAAFTGRSRIVAPDGSILAEGAVDAADMKVVEIDPEVALDKTVTGRNNLFSDRRPDMYRLG